MGANDTGEEITQLDDLVVTPRTALVGEDLKYWLAHPELPVIVSHFIAKALDRRPSDAQAFARELFGQRDFKDRIFQAIARNGGSFNIPQPQERATAPVVAKQDSRRSSTSKQSGGATTTRREERKQALTDAKK